MRKSNIKLLSIISAIFTAVTLWGGRFPVFASEEYQTIVIRPENFGLSEGSDAVIDGTQWALSGANKLSGTEYTLNNTASVAANAAEATLPIYITQDGDYRMFVLMRDLNDNNQTRLISAGIDEQYEYFGGKLKLKGNSALKTQVPDNYMKYVAPLPAGVTLGSVGYYWDGAAHDYDGVAESDLETVDGVPSRYDHQLFRLTKGRHIFKLKNEFANYKSGFVSAILITNDPQFDGLDNYSAPSYAGQPEPFLNTLDTLRDTVAPSFAGDLFAGEVSDNSVTVNWNTEDTDIVFLEVSVNDETETVEYSGENSYTFTGLNEAAEYTFGIKILDSLGQYDYREITVTTGGTVDTEPPSFTGLLTASADETGKINLSWQAALDNKGIAKYVIYLDDMDTKVKEVGGSETSASISAPRGRHTVYVCAVDFAGNISEPISAQADVQGVTNIMLRPDNFTYNKTDKGWQKTGENRILFGDRTVLGKENSDAETANAQVYLEKGSYRMLAYVLDPQASPGSRAFTVEVDGKDGEYEFVKKGIKTQTNKEQNAFYDYWDTGFVFEADHTGLHELTVSTLGANVKFYGILITSNLQVSAATLTADVIAEYEDIIPPRKPDWSILANSLNGAYMQASGDGVVYTVTDAQGNVIKQLEGGNGVIENISALKEYEYGITAYDTHGNAAQGENKRFYMSPVLAEWNLGESNGDVKVDYKLTSNSIQEASGLLILAVYDKDGACLDYVTRDCAVSVGGTAEGELSLPCAAFQTARVMLWDNAEDMHPLALSAEYSPIP